MAIKRVALFGANGNLGAPILDALVGAKCFEVSILRRASSKSKPAHADSVRIVEVDDALSLDSLQSALTGQDACVVAMPLSDLGQHLRIADAAAAAGVQHFIPADFGSCDSSTAFAQDVVPLFKQKTEVRERLQALAASHPGFAWTALVNGHFYDWGLRENFLHFDLAARTADILDDGKYRTSLSTLARVADAVVKVLQQPEVGHNKTLFLQSFCVSQLDVLAALEKVTGQKWKVNWVKSDEFIRDYRGKADAGDKDAIDHLVFAVGVVDGDWEKKDGFAMKALGLKDENLEEVTRKVVSKA